MDAFSHVNAEDKYMRKGKHENVEHIFGGPSRPEPGHGSDEKSRLRDWDKYQAYGPKDTEHIERFEDIPYKQTSRTQYLNDGKTIVFSGDEKGDNLNDFRFDNMHQGTQEAERRKSRIHEGRAMVFSGEDHGEKDPDQDPRRPPATKHMDDVRSYNLQSGKQQAPEAQEKHWRDERQLSREKRLVAEKPSLERVKRFDDDKPYLERVKRLDDDKPSLERVKRMDDEKPYLERVKRLDDDESSYRREHIIHGEPQIFKGLPVNPHLERFYDEEEPLSRMKRLQDERLLKHDKELSRMKRLDGDESPEETLKSDDENGNTDQPDDRAHLNEKHVNKGRKHKRLHHDKLDDAKHEQKQNSDNRKDNKRGEN